MNTPETKQPGGRTGRPPKIGGDLTQKKSVTLRASTWAAIEKAAHDRESLSAAVDRLVRKALAL
jgi:hypothetical protein